MTTHARRTVRREFDRLANRYAAFQKLKPGREIREFIAWIRPGSSKSVLDAACGTGALVRTLDRAATRTFALDISSAMLKLARRRPPRSGRLIMTIGDVECLPYTNESFDLVTCAYAFANFPDPLRVLREFARVTRFDGRVAILDVVAPEDPAAHLYFNRLESGRSHCYTRVLKQTEFLRLFEEARLRLDSWRARRRRVAFSDWVRLSPALTEKRQRERCRQLLEQLQRHVAPFRSRPPSSKPALQYRTAWFLLRKA